MAVSVETQRVSRSAPPPGAPLRLAFVGQSSFFRACALDDVVPGVRTAFFDYRKGLDAERMLDAVERFAPHALVVFRPEIIPSGLFADLRAVTLGFLTEPLPRKLDGEVHEDLKRRLWELEQVDRANFDRVVSFDPYIAEVASASLPVWRSLPIPVADRYYAPVRPIEGRPRPLFVGRSTPHREWMLTKAKHAHDVVHFAFGVDADDLEALMREHDVTINVHNQKYLSFENRVCLHLAAGHLVLTEPLSPAHGLEKGLDYVEVGTPDFLLWQLDLLADSPDLHHRVRVRGRRKAELYRASRVYPRLIADLYEDLAAFGSTRG